MNFDWERSVRELETAFALVDIARAAQQLRAERTRESAAKLFQALERWEHLTGQTEQTT